MERPEHNLRGQMGGTAAQLAPRRFGGLVIVAAIHIGIVVLLIVGMVAGEIEKKKEDIQATVEQQKVEAKAPPPPPPDVVKPPPPFVPPPDIMIQTEAPPTTTSITTTQVRPPTPPPPAPPAPPPPAAPPAAPPTPPEIIAATHTNPPYPPISQRLGEQGVSLLNITIDENGRCTDAAVATTSGSNRLDTAAIDYVKQRYRWKPATQGGKPVSVRTQIKVVWSLKDAQ